MALYDFNEFIRLSAVLNYNLSATTLNRYKVLNFILAGKQFCENELQNREQKSIVMEALNYLFDAYHQKRRRLGPMAILHPLRATAMFSRAFDAVSLIDILSLLFHDVPEDVRPKDFEDVKWKRMEAHFYTLFDRLDAENEDRLLFRLNGLTKRDDESYYKYISRLIGLRSGARLIQIKMADRLDNTLDMRIDLSDPMEGINFFETVFNILFIADSQGYLPEMIHQPALALNGSRRLYQLFKNTVLLSMIRRHHAIDDLHQSPVLFNAIAHASLNEAQRIFIHLISHHLQDVQQQRQLLLKSMEYCHCGKISRATLPDDSQVMDGLFMNYFGIINNRRRNRKLDALYEDKSLMIQASIAFIVIFFSFLNQPQFYVKGISDHGIEPG
jgi:hypothetical protein